MARRWTRYWNFSMGVDFMARRRRPGGGGGKVSNWGMVATTGLGLTSLGLDIEALDGGRGEAICAERFADVGRVGQVVVTRSGAQLARHVGASGGGHVVDSNCGHTTDRKGDMD